MISDGSGQTPETMKLATELAAHNDLIAIFIYDPLEAELPDIGRAVLAEGDRQIEVDLSAADLRRRFASGFAELAGADRAHGRCSARFPCCRSVPIAIRREQLRDADRPADEAGAA